MSTVSNSPDANSAPSPQPTFLGIGVPKGATTWLYELLETHPDVYLSRNREVHFFDRDSYFSRGLNWYLDLFTSEGAQHDYKAIGEITPTYLYCTAERIEYIVRELPSISKFICIVRNPVERAYSHYWFFRRIGANEPSMSFEEFLEQPEIAIERGLYARHLKNWFQYFDQKQFLILVFEEIFQDVDSAKQQISDFLDIDVAAFPADAGVGKVNERFNPRFPRLYAFGVRFARKLRDWNLYGFARSLRSIGGGKALAKRDDTEEYAPMKAETRDYLRDLYAPDTQELEALLGRNIAAWKNSS